jgi:hypothetical protein
MSLDNVSFISHKRDWCNGRIGHGPYIVDEALDFVECGSCGKTLNPIYCLIEMSRNESRYKAKIEEKKRHLEKLTEKIAKQSRVLCKHCRQYTEIRK